MENEMYDSKPRGNGFRKKQPPSGGARNANNTRKNGGGVGRPRPQQHQRVENKNPRVPLSEQTNQNRYFNQNADEGSKQNYRQKHVPQRNQSNTLAKPKNQRLLKDKRKLRKKKFALHIGQQPNSQNDSSDSEHSSGSADEAFPRQVVKKDGRAFTDKLSLFSPQKRIPKRVSRDALIDTIFKSLFEEKQRQSKFKAWDDTDTENDEEMIKQGLEIALSRELNDEILYGLALGTPSAANQSNLFHKFVDKTLVRKLVNELRFEDDRTTSARIPILRAIYRKCPHLQYDLVEAIQLALSDRKECLQKKLWEFYHKEVDSEKVDREDRDHANGLLELFQFLVEEIFSGTPVISGRRLNFDQDEETSVDAAIDSLDRLIEKMTKCLLILCLSHTNNSPGADDDEIINCVGQFIMYHPPSALWLLENLIRNWPRDSSLREIFFVRLCARIMLVSPRQPQQQKSYSVDRLSRINLQLMKRICKSLRSEHVQVSREVLSLFGSQFVMNFYILGSPEIFNLVRSNLSENAKHHWNEVIRELSDENFDRLLDYC